MSAEFTAGLALSRQAVDRDYLARARPDLLRELRTDPAARALVLHGGEAMLAADRLALLPMHEVPASALLLYLGRSVDGGTPYAAAIVSESDAAALVPEDSGSTVRWGNLRTVGNALDDLEAGLFTEALALANWNDSHAFSPRTGSAAESTQGGWVRRAPDDRHDMFPRTDAAIIVGVTDGDDRLLLGSNAMWKSNRYSLLAGFVEPGESLEAAVVREVFEESGVRVIAPEYLGSQPWPFPASLMVGFRARVDPDRPTALEPDGEEILDLRWFSRDELRESLGEIALPGRTSIARAIIEDWYGGPIDDRREW